MARKAAALLLGLAAAGCSVPGDGEPPTPREDLPSDATGDFIRSSDGECAVPGPGR